MRTAAARAMIWGLLDDLQKQQVRRMETNSPMGRYLTGFEIVRMFGLKYPPFDPDLCKQVDDACGKWEWVKEQIHYSKHGNIDDCDCSVDKEALYEWQEYVETQGLLPEIEGVTSQHSVRFAKAPLPLPIPHSIEGFKDGTCICNDCINGTGLMGNDLEKLRDRQRKAKSKTRELVAQPDDAF